MPRLLSRRQWTAVGLLLTAAVVGLLVPSPFGGRAAASTFDLLHFPAFTAITWLAQRIGCRSGLRKLSHRLAIAAGLMLASASIEALQAVSGRSPSVADLVSNLSGVVAGWLVFEAGHASSTRQRWLQRASAVGLGLVVSLGPSLVLWDCWKMRNEFPLIGSFESRAELGRWWRRDANLSLSKSLVTDGRYGLRLHVRPGDMPGLSHLHLPADWSRYAALQFDVAVPAEPPVADRVRLRVKWADGYHGTPGESAAVQEFDLRPGEPQRITIPLRESGQDSAHSAVNLEAVRILEFLFPEIREPLDVDFDQIRLVPQPRAESL